MVARGKQVLSRFSPLGESRAFLVVGYVAGDTAITVARRNFPEQHLRYHRAEHDAVANPQIQRGRKNYRETSGSADLADCIGASVCLAAELGSRIWYE